MRDARRTEVRGAPATGRAPAARTDSDAATGRWTNAAAGGTTSPAVVGVTLHGIAVMAVQAVLGVALLVAGGTKLADEELHVDQFEHFGYPQWFRQATGAMEVLAAVALLAGIVAPTPLVALAGGLLAVAVMLGAVATHVRIGDDLPDMRGPLVLLVLALVVVAVQASFLVA